MKKKIIFLIIVLLLIIIVILSYLLLNNNKITINTNGGKLIKNIEVKNDEIISLPEIQKEGYKVVTYINENKKIVKKGTKINKNTKITPIYVNENEEQVNITFYDENEIIESINLNKNNELILPTDPIKEGYIFSGWLINDNVLIGESIITTDTVLKAIWIPINKELVTITIISNNKEIAKIKQEKGTKIKLPTPIKSDTLAFEEWQDNENNTITNQTVLEKDLIIHGVYAKYNCPSDCIINQDNKTCSKISTTNMVSKTRCPDGSKEYYGRCMNLSKKESAAYRQCDDWGDTGSEVFYNNYCYKRVKKVTVKECPNGYKKNNETCEKNEVIACTKDNN